MNIYSIRYWWSDRRGEQTATTVAMGNNPEHARKLFLADNAHVQNAAIISKTTSTPPRASVPRRSATSVGGVV